MPKIINDPLREGMSSKIYLLAYNGPITGYKIASKIYGKKTGSVPLTNKIYKTADKLIEMGALKKTEKGYISLSEGTLNSITQIFVDNNVELSELECYMLGKVLDSGQFRNLIERSFFYQKGFFTNDVDAIRQITEFLGLTAFWMYLFKVDHKYSFQTKKEFDEHWNECKDCNDFYVNHHVITVEDLKEYSNLDTLLAKFEEEEAYFKKYKRFKKGGMYEDDEKKRLIARDDKKIKYWCMPSSISHVSYTLLKKLCQLSQTYILFQTVSNEQELFEKFRVKMEEDIFAQATKPKHL